MKRVAMISLGCSKNRVDAETMLGYLDQEGYCFECDPQKADVLIVNTCGFIREAKEEAIDAIFEMAEHKKRGNGKLLIVTGCMAERYTDELMTEIPEIDAVVGISHLHEISSMIGQAMLGNKPKACGNLTFLQENFPRKLTTLQGTAYMKIADGCDNHCTYCAIPTIRGKYRSRKMASLVAEAKQLQEKGVKELILVAQDTTRYGLDIYGKTMLVTLLKELAQIDGLMWIRVLYMYPEMISEELLNYMAEEPKMCRYIDAPIQHISNEILSAMNRRSSKEDILGLVKRIRNKEHEFTLRTSIIVGFPGETEEQFDELCLFLQQYPFDRVGVFAYSQEEGTSAADMEHQIPEDVKQLRKNKLMIIQQRISEERLQKRVGESVEVLVGGYHAESDLYWGRSRMEAPEIDGKIFFHTTHKPVPGDMVLVDIKETFEYDLLGDM